MNSSCPTLAPTAIRQVIEWPIRSSSGPAAESAVNQAFSMSRSTKPRCSRMRPMRRAISSTRLCGSFAPGSDTWRNTGAAAARRSRPAALQVGLELLLDIASQRPAGCDAKLAKGWVVLLDKLIQQRRLGPVASIAGRIEKGRCARLPHNGSGGHRGCSGDGRGRNRLCGPVRISVCEAYHDDEQESVCQAGASNPSGRSLSLS